MRKAFFPTTVMVISVLLVAGCGESGDDPAPSASQVVTDVQLPAEVVEDTAVARRAEDENSSDSRHAICAATKRAYRCMVVSNGKVVDEPKGTAADNSLSPRGEEKIIDVRVAQDWSWLIIALCQRKGLTADVRAALHATSACMVVNPSS